MKRVVLFALLISSLYLPHRAAVADEWFAVGPQIGYSLRQIALDRPGGRQTDLAYQFVTIGATAQFFGLRQWVGVKIRGAAELYQGLRIDDQAQIPGFWQMAVTAEILPTFTYLFGDVGIAAGVGLGFTHYFEGNTPDGVLEPVTVAAQEQLSIPAFIGVTIDAGGILLTPEVGVAYAFWYDSEAPDVRAGLDDGSVTARGLDLWLRLSLTAPIL